MHLGFIGMSGAGKSYWGTQFAEAGYTCIHCDDCIAARLGEELEEPLPTLEAVGNWMGLPNSPGYETREARYLAHERQVLRAVVDRLAQAQDQAHVIDMTGSAIYVGDDLWDDLRRHLTVVYFAVSPDVHEQMLQSYVRRPRPVLWNGLYQPVPAESVHATLARCYPRLIAQREKLYESLAHVHLPYHVHRQPGLTPEDLLQIIHDRKQSAPRLRE